ncbi:MAG: co-chaperone GroES [Minisyncoccales bacterium]
MKIKPLSNNIIIEQIKEEKVKGDFLFQPAEKDGPKQGRVISVGPGKKNSAGKVVPMDVKKGDVVLFSKYAPHEIKIGDKEYLVLKEEDILCVIE